MRERQNLEMIKEVCDWYYKKTEDPFYENISKQVARKLRKDTLYVQKLTNKKQRATLNMR